VEGDFCYQFAPGTQSVRSYFVLGNRFCGDTARSDDIAPCPVTPDCPLAFQDVTTKHRFHSEISSLAALKVVSGVTSGYEDGSFKPEDSMTRGQAVKTLVLAFNIQLGTSSEGSSVAHFSDVSPTSPYYPYVEAAYREGLVSGYKDGTFQPEQAITRGALIKMAVAAAVQGAGWALVKPQTPTFADVSADSPLYAYIETAAARGILADVAAPGGSFQAEKAATRGESAALVARAMPSPISNLPESLEPC
jgi:hypothetical protein